MVLETEVQAARRLRAGQDGWKLWRNNVGALRNPRGRLVRFGLANESKQMNEKFKSADLIGWRPILITEEMVGMVIAQFSSLESKRDYKNKPSKAQMNWYNLVAADGGYAEICDHIEP